MSISMEEIFSSFAHGYVKDNLRTFVRCEYCGELISHPYKYTKIEHGMVGDVNAIHIDITISHRCKESS